LLSILFILLKNDRYKYKTLIAVSFTIHQRIPSDSIDHYLFHFLVVCNSKFIFIAIRVSSVFYNYQKIYTCFNEILSFHI